MFTHAPHVLILFVLLFLGGTMVGSCNIFFSFIKFIYCSLVIWSCQLVFIFGVLSNFTYSLTHLTCSAPTIVNALGHSPNCTQLLTVRSSSTTKGSTYLTQRYKVPPYICSFVFNIVSAYFCDKYKNRGVMTAVCAVISVAGYAISLSASHLSSRCPKNKRRSTVFCF